MNGFPSSTHFEDAVRDLHMRLPYHRLFGAHVVDDGGDACRGARRRTRELEPT